MEEWGIFTTMLEGLILIRYRERTTTKIAVIGNALLISCSNINYWLFVHLPTTSMILIHLILKCIEKTNENLVPSKNIFIWKCMPMTFWSQDALAHWRFDTDPLSLAPITFIPWLLYSKIEFLTISQHALHSLKRKALDLLNNYSSVYWLLVKFRLQWNPDSKIHGANIGPTWGRQDPGGLHVGHMNLAIWDTVQHCEVNFSCLSICIHVNNTG